jgi:hypothetical protein
MNIILKKPVAAMGYDFIPAAYLPENKDEYHLRNLQNRNGIQYRKLSAYEIEALVRNRNTSDDWNKLLVSDAFNPELVKNCKFYGLVRIGMLEPYWFVSLYAQIIAVVALASLFPGVGRRLAAGPWPLLTLVFWALMTTHILLEVLDLRGLSYLQFGDTRTRGLLECLPIFLLGWMLQAAANPRQWATAALASSVWLASSAHVLPPDRLVIFGSAILLLLWKSDLSVPRAWARAASRLASTTMWVYLLHVPIITVLWNLPLPQPARLTIALVTSFGLSVAAKTVFDRLSDRLMLAKAPAR